MYLSKAAIEQLPQIKRLNLINSVSGIKPGNLIGTKSDSGQPNLAIFSSVIHLGSSPALLGFILRPKEEVRRHTYENILENGFYTINQIREDFTQQAHYTAAKFDADISEFDACALTEEYLDNFPAPYVKESLLKIGMKHLESIEIQANNTTLVIGTIEHLYVPDEAVDERGYLDLEYCGAVGISGLNSYFSLKKRAEYPYARVHDSNINFKK